MTTTMLTWQADGRPGMEGARVHLGPPPSGFRALGRIVRPDPDGDLTASYSLVVREDGTPGRLSLSVATTGFEKHLTLQQEDGLWLLDDGAGSAQPRFDGADAVDVAFSPIFNALPIRRLRAHLEPVDADVSVVRVDLPDLAVSRVTQHYRTIRTVEGDSPAVVELTWDDYRAELEVSADGFVIAYPGLATLVSGDRRESAPSV